MRKCVSMVAAATAAVGLAGCSSPHRTREPAGAAQPLSTAPSPDAHAAAGNPGSVPPVGVDARVKAANQPPAAAKQQPPGVQRAPDGTLEGVADARVGTGAADSPGSPAAAVPGVANPGTVNPGGQAPAPSGTTPMSAPLGHSVTGHAAPPKAAPAKASTVPPAALPAPAPPTSGTAGNDSQPSAMAQLVEAMAAAQSDGKAVLLDFGAGDSAESRALDAALRAPQSRAVLARSYHVVHIDPGSGDPGLMKIAAQYAFGASGGPLLVVLSPDGTVRADSIHNGRPRYDDAGVAAWLRQWAR
ncbi:MAG: hypothetical protein HOV87_27840 [Catenulispora sp.]|nr:hypothetical protein [Catenulispora sp.]